MKSCLAIFSAYMLIFLVSCQREADIIPIDHPLANRIDFQDPVVGQKNQYLTYWGKCGELQPTGDTLVLRINGIAGDSLFMQEGYTSGSPSYSLFPLQIGAKWSKDVIEIAADVRVQSALFYFYGSDFLQLKQEHDRKMIQQNCLVQDNNDVFTGDAIGRVPQFEIEEHQYLQKKIVSCVPVILDLDGYLLYDQHHLYASLTSSLTSCCGQPDPDEPMVFAYALITEQ